MGKTEQSVDLTSDRFLQDRYGYIEELRAQNFWARTAEGAVVFFNQPDVMEVFRCVDFQFAFNKIDESRSPYLAKAIQHELLNMHGEQHKRLSLLVKKALRDRVIDGLRNHIDTIIDDLIDALPDSGTVDFCASFGDPLPARVMGPMFDIPYEEADGLNEWIKIGGRKVDALQSGVGIEEVEDANRNIHTYLRDLLKQRQSNPGQDLFSELMLAEIDGDRMSEDELVYLSGELASAGVDTTRAQLPLILNALLDNPDELKKLKSDPSLATATVNEGMRFAPLPWVIPHRAVHDVVYKDIAFKKGDLAFTMVPAANRDPSVIENPNAFDITRKPARHFAFGAGMHSCPGAHLARIEMATALQKLATSFDVIERAADPVWEPGQTDRTLKELQIRVQKSS